MPIFRLMTRWRSWVLAWFALSLGAAVASPLVQPRAWELVCSSAGTTALVAHDTRGDAALETPSIQGMDCPLCLLGHAPPLPSPVGVALVAASHHLPAATPGVWVAVWTAIPPPARAPPLLSLSLNSKEAHYV